ncbi:MAG: FAD:protein FMN transferase [Microthrixaceae bacterium]
MDTAPSLLPDRSVPGHPADADEATGQRSAVARLMGTEAHVLVVGPGPDPETLLDELRHLERRWSRFLADSELSRLGRGRGAWTLTSTETAGLVARSVLAWERTGGLFDPTVVGTLEGLGYDRDLAEVRGGRLCAERPPGPAGVEADESARLVRLPAGIRIDPGGIGKGLAADLVVAAALDGADPSVGVLVSVGGDLRVGGCPPPGGWEIEVDHGAGPLQRVNLTAGAVATSSTLRRRWETADGPAHHVVDPRTGLPSAGPAVSVTAIAGEAWWAEAVATALLVGLGGELPDRLLAELASGRVGAVATLADGGRVRLGAATDAIVDEPGTMMSMSGSDDGGDDPGGAA